jgi:hypothetical protein
MRQPKIYIKLPSEGRFWKEGSLDISPNGEYAVYSMTARDELLLKTPDALMNGQAVVDVVQNCVPAIRDAWEMPSIDVDVILIALRLATYGDQMTMTAGPDSAEYGIDLRSLLDILYDTVSWDERINVGTDMAIFIKPVNYKVMSKTSVKTFETQKLMSIINDSTLTEEEKINTFRDSFKKLTELTVGIINDSVFRIESASGTTENAQDIQEFMDNCDKSIFDAVKNKLDELREKNTLKAMKVRATDEMIEKGSPEEIEIPLTFDPASFFE